MVVALGFLSGFHVGVGKNEEGDLRLLLIAAGGIWWGGVKGCLEWWIEVGVRAWKVVKDGGAGNEVLFGGWGILTVLQFAAVIICRGSSGKRIVVNAVDAGFVGLCVLALVSS